MSIEMQPVSQPVSTRRPSWGWPNMWRCAAVGFVGTGAPTLLVALSTHLRGSATWDVMLLGFVLPAVVVAAVVRERRALNALAALCGSVVVVLSVLAVWTIVLIKSILSTNWFFA